MFVRSGLLMRPWDRTQFANGDFVLGRGAGKRVTTFRDSEQQCLVRLTVAAREANSEQYSTERATKSQDKSDFEKCLLSCGLISNMRIREICGLYFFRRLAHGYHELMNFSGGCDGPVAVFEFAEHPGYRNRAELPAVLARVPVIAHDEAFVFGHGDFRKIGRRMALRDKNAILCAVVVFIANLTGCSRNGARPNGLQRKLYAIHI
jgi:hypothetical protein